MKILDGKDWKGDLQRQLNDGQPDFQFDQRGLRNRLMLDIEEGQLARAERRVRERAQGPFLKRHKWATVAAMLVLAVGGTGIGLAKTDLSQPGDALHGLDQLQEQAILSLPWPETQKARIRADIADERNQELDLVLEAAAAPEIRNAALDDSISSLDAAIENARSSRAGFASQGKGHDAEKMTEVLRRMEGLAERQEKRMLELRDREIDEQARKRFDARIIEVQEYRKRAGTESQVGTDGRTEGASIEQKSKAK